MRKVRVPAWVNERKILPLQVFGAIFVKREGISWALKSLGGLVGSWSTFNSANFCEQLLMAGGELHLSYGDMIDFFKGISDVDEIFVIGLNKGVVVAEFELVDSTYWNLSFESDFIDYYE